MSNVSDIILIASLDEDILEEEDADRLPLVEEINARLAERDFAELVNLSEIAGVQKAMQAHVFGGAFNYLDLDAFLRIVRNRTWKAPNKVQLLVKSEDDDRFRLIEM